MPQVAHVVTGADLQTGAAWAVRVMAEAPDTALDLVAQMPEQAFQRLPRVTE